jgi:hypothetical protein
VVAAITSRLIPLQAPRCRSFLSRQTPANKFTKIRHTCRHREINSHTAKQTATQQRMKAENESRAYGQACVRACGLEGRCLPEYRY